MVSTPRESLLFRFNSPATVTRLNPEVAGLTLDKPTIALANIRKRLLKGGKSTYSDSSCIVQVTAGAVTLVEYDSQLEMFHRVGPSWTPGSQESAWMGRRIVAASINPSQIVVALSGGAVVLLNLNDDGHLSFVQYVYHSYKSRLVADDMQTSRIWSIGDISDFMRHIRFFQKLFHVHRRGFLE